MYICWAVCFVLWSIGDIDTDMDLTLTVHVFFDEVSNISSHFTDTRVV